MYLKKPLFRWAAFVSCVLLSFVLNLTAPSPAMALTCAFKNPLIALGQDPSVAYKDGAYYLVQSSANSIIIKKAEYLTDLGNAPNVTIFTPPAGQSYSADIWAPEIVYLNGAWYVYFAADDSAGDNAQHRLYVLQADTPDPLGTWTFKGKVYHDAATDKWAIDGSVFDYQDKLYMVWSGWPGDQGDFPQNLYIAAMSDPLTVSGTRSQIAAPDQPWEMSVKPIEEGPEPFIHVNQLSIVYSADASWTAAYKLGMLKLAGSDPLNAASWVKIGPIFQQITAPDGSVYGPGHNSIPVKSPDGTQDWLVYHAKSKASNGWDDRQILAQPFSWKADNTPDLGQPIVPADGVVLPSGQPCGISSHLALDANTQFDSPSMPDAKIVGTPTWTSGKIGSALHFNGSSDFLDLNSHLLNTMGSYSVSAWAQLDRTDGTYTLISQEGGLSSEFALQYSAEAGGKFAFTFFSTQGQMSTQALSTTIPALRQWYFVTGVRDTLNKQIRVYVDGKLESSVPFTGDWETKGHTIVGAARQRSKRVQFFAGTLDEVDMVNGALNDSDVQALYQSRR